jgi:hypothetical protein
LNIRIPGLALAFAVTLFSGAVAAQEIQERTIRFGHRTTPTTP